ncbi:MAG: FkbM family methyltransferase [Opitutaceae bacterium]|nr:FkbM family methyltransferase [Opitutaceae bacterium]
MPYINHIDFIQACSKDGFIIENLICDWYRQFAGSEKTGVCIDGGAYQGFHTLRMCQFFTKRVYSIEANPTSFNELEDRMTQWPKDLTASPIPLNIALTGPNNEKEVSFFTSERHPGRSSLNPKIWESLSPGEVDYTESQGIDASTLDKLVNDYQIDDVSLIKLDLEGAEVDALLGGIKTLKETRPAIVLEFGLRKHNENVFGQNLEDFFALLDDASYSAYLPWGAQVTRNSEIPFWYLFAFPNENSNYKQYLEKAWATL